MATSRQRLPTMFLLGTVLLLFSVKVLAVGAVLGVDLGTEHIKAALVKPGIPLEIVLTKDSRRKETSAVAFKPPKAGPSKDSYPERIYGADALALAARYPGEVFPNLKTVLGLSVDDAVVKEYAARHPGLQLKPSPNRPTVAFKSNTLTADQEAWRVEELLAMELQNVQKNAEAAAGDGSSIRSIVLTIPPFYTIEERRVVQSAAEVAGLRVLALISDGLAVGLNYATSRQFPNINEGARPEHHMVFDMGAGSTTASILRFQSRTVKDTGKLNKTIQEIQLVGSGWDRTLGGDSLNYVIVDDMVSKFVDSDGAKAVSATAAGVKSNGRAMSRILKESERVRQTLSANIDTQASFEELYEDVDFKYKITRSEFEAMAEAYGERVAATIRDAVKMSGVELSELTSVILHGGATRTPFVQKTLEQIVGDVDKIRTSVNADEAAVFGAGFRAADLSPSFRVKEIRTSEGPMYPAGVKWTGSKQKQQRQRLWTATSPIGGPAKEVTFTDKEDFSMAFFQQVGSDDRAINSLVTKNLTATIAAMKSKYPSCDEADLAFKVGVKLSAENAEVQVVKAAVECQAEVVEKEGFVDGVKNLLGLGKKDQQPLSSVEDKDQSASSSVSDDATKETTTTSSAVDESSTTSTATSSTDTSTSSATSETGSKASAPSEESKPVIKKKEMVSIPVEIAFEQAGLSSLSAAEFSKAQDKLKKFAASDEARIQRDEALNQLEAYTYKLRDLLTSDDFVAHSTDEERKKLATMQSETSEWFDQEGDMASKEVLKAKLKGLTSLVAPIQKRISEAEERPELVASFKQFLSQTQDRVNKMHQEIAEYNARQAQASANSSSTSATASSSPSQPPTADEASAEEKGDKKASTDSTAKAEAETEIVPPPYKAEDIQELESLYKSTQEWFVDAESRQKGLAASADPVLLSKDLVERRKKLEKLSMELVSRGTKKKGGKTKSGKTQSKSKKAEKGKGEERFSGPELQKMLEKIQRMKEEKDKAEGRGKYKDQGGEKQQEAAKGGEKTESKQKDGGDKVEEKQEAAKGEKEGVEGGKPGHDEL